jgi:hypothetical protein
MLSFCLGLTWKFPGNFEPVAAAERFAALAAQGTQLKNGRLNA